MRMAVALREGIQLAQLPTEYSRMSCDWRDPATEAISQEMDAAVKGKEADLLDIEAGQKMIGVSSVERAAIKARRAEEAAAATTADVRARMDLARELVRTDGLTLNAAMAAVGLLAAASTNSAESAAPATGA